MSLQREQQEREKRRKADLAEMVTEEDFLDLTPFWATNASIFILIGSRCGGKTYGTLKECIKDYKNTGKRFVYVRRLKESLTMKNMGDLLLPFIQNDFCKPLIKELWGEDYSVRYFRGRFEVINEEDSDIAPELIGYSASLNTVGTDKGKNYDNVYNIVLDEFLPLKSERIIKEEFDAWEQLQSTVYRSHGDQAKLYLVGNTVTKYSSYLYNYNISNKMINDTTGSIQIINLSNGPDVEPTKVAFLHAKANEKLGRNTSKLIRNSKMAVTGEWEMDDITCCPHVQNERATEKMVCTLYDTVMEINLGIFLRNVTYNTVEVRNHYQFEVPHQRQFLIVRETPKQSSYYHLTTVKGLTYNCWTNLKTMLKDIKDRCHIDIQNEFDHNRIYAESMDAADYFRKVWKSYMMTDPLDLF